MRGTVRALGTSAAVLALVGAVSATSHAVGGTSNAPPDRAVTTAGDADGLHVLVADASSGYRWRTAATLAEPGYDTDRWIGTACVTGSASRAVVVYAPRQFTNGDRTRDRGGFVAVVDLGTGAVRKLAVHASLAYHNPGCGTGEDVAVSAHPSATSTAVTLVDAASGRTRGQVSAPGQVTSAVPFGGGVAAVTGHQLVALVPGRSPAVLSTESGLPLRLHPDASGGLGYEVADGHTAQVKRYASGRSTLLGSGTVQLAGSAGRVFVLGPDSGRIRSAPGWSSLAVPVDTEPSSTGALVVLSSSVRAGAPVTIQAMLTATKAPLTATVRPAPPRPAEGRAAAPHAAAPHDPTDPGTVPYDPDRACAVPRNDPTVQTLQATAPEVEWATDLAVHGRLTVNRPANWMDSGMPSSWQPQGLFAPHALSGGGTVPAQVLLGVLAQESNTMQASPHAVDGLTANVNQGGFYGDWVSWDTADCGYGVGQVTTGMAIADGSSRYTPLQQKAIDTDYASNIAASLNALVDKWNALRTAGITANGGDPQYIENWYLAAWAYNTGIQPDANHGNTTGCTPGPGCDDGAGNWGLGWANNPANPDYPVDRGRFDGNNPFDTKHPNLWPYQEKVLGWAFTPVARFDYVAGNWAPAYLAGNWPSGGPRVPGFMTFCTPAANHCVPNSVNDVNGHFGAGQCTRDDFHCWWHLAVTWAPCSSGGGCGTEAVRFGPGDAEPALPSVYPPDCSTAGLPLGAVIVDDVRTSSALPCHKTWADQGTFGLRFAAAPAPDCTAHCIVYQGKIDFHQLGTGFGGHLWFTHTTDTPLVTGTWTPPSTVTGWTRVLAHVPQSGATTGQADYVVHLGNGQSRHRMVSQARNADAWVDLGTFNLAAGASVSLANASPNVARGHSDGGDLAYDAVAFAHTQAPAARYVAIGDSYASGESDTPFDADSDRPGADECHRSGAAYPFRVTIARPADVHALACSGASTVDLTQASVLPDNVDNTPWRTVDDYRYGEVNQVDESGWLDQDTTLVTVTVGADDVGWRDVLAACRTAACTSGGYRLTRASGTDPQPLVSYEPYLIGQLRWHLAAVYRAVHANAPHARVLVVGYPHLFDVSPVCEGFAPDVQSWLNGLSDQLAQAATGAVADVRQADPSADVVYVDTRAGFTGHGVCEASGASWLTGADGVHPAFSFQLNATGQAQYAHLVDNARCRRAAPVHPAVAADGGSGGGSDLIPGHRIRPPVDSPPGPRAGGC